MASIRHLAILLVFSATTIWASPVSAQDWQRLDDGRVVIEVFGEKLAVFPEDGRMVRFWKGQTEELFNLEAAIADPRMVRKRLAELELKDWVWVVVGNGDHNQRQQKGRKFLGRFDWSEIPTAVFPNQLGFSIVKTLADQPGHKPYLPLPNEYLPNAVGPSEWGFVAYLPDGVQIPPVPVTESYSICSTWWSTDQSIRHAARYCLQVDSCEFQAVLVALAEQ